MKRVRADRAETPAVVALADASWDVDGGTWGILARPTVLDVSFNTRRLQVVGEETERVIAADAEVTVIATAEQIVYAFLAHDSVRQAVAAVNPYVVLPTLRPGEELPTIDQVGGSDPDFTGGVESAEYVRRMRDGDPAEGGNE